MGSLPSRSTRIRPCATKWNATTELGSAFISRHSSRVTWAETHQRAENSPSRKTPPLRRATRRRSDRASMDGLRKSRRIEQDCRRHEHFKPRAAALHCSPGQGAGTAALGRRERDYQPWIGQGEQMKDWNGYEITGADAAGLAQLERAAAQLRCYIEDPVASVEQAIAANPECVMAHVLHAWMHLLGTDAAAVAVARDVHARALRLPANARERAHLHAIGLLLENRWHAAARALEDLTVAWPLDSIALQAGHQIDFFIGDSRMLRDRIARALPHWSPSMPGYHALLGMHAFGLEESGQYDVAEAQGRRAVELEPRDAWAQHAVAHVCEMQGR